MDVGTNSKTIGNCNGFSERVVLMAEERSNVGMSSRTPLKHWILQACLGRIVGVGGSGRTKDFADFGKYGLKCVDLCAGDGQVVEGVHTSSAYLMFKNCSWASNHRVESKRFDTEIAFVEKNPHTAAALTRSIEGYDQHIKENVAYNIIVGDAKNCIIHAESHKQPIFINADPNNVDQLPVSYAFMDSLTPASTYVATLGCNPQGLKRLPLERREGWYEYVKTLTEKLPSYHDVILCYIVNDSAQWAYMARIPRKWADQSMEDFKKVSVKRFGYELNITSLKTSSETFDRMLDHLFLTKREKESLNV